MGKWLEPPKLYLGDCLVEMNKIEDKSIDLILTDLPFQTTGCAWDQIIPFEPLWGHYKRIIKHKGAIVLFAMQPFTTAVISSNLPMFKYCWYMEKTKGANFALTGFQPLKVVEDIIVFSNAACTYTKNGNGMKYNPQKEKRDKPYTRNFERNKAWGTDSLVVRGNGKGGSSKDGIVTYEDSHPRNLIYGELLCDKRIHSTQKPLSVMEYMIKTYTNEGDTVLDSCMGSGTTGVACYNTHRKFIGIEKDEDYFNAAFKRMI